MMKYMLRFVIPAAYAILPPEMSSPEATAMLLAIGLQESKFLFRRQIHGPARGFWQFEGGPLSATANVLGHHKTSTAIEQVLQALRYDSVVDSMIIHPVLEDNDVLAACFARCQLWTSPHALPGPQDASAGWDVYVNSWHPGKPHRETWDGNYGEAWSLVLGGREIPKEEKA